VCGGDLEKKIRYIFCVVSGVVLGFCWLVCLFEKKV